LFDELQSQGSVDAAPKSKALWSITVADDDWQHRFTFLRLQPSLIWTDEPMTVDPLPTDEASESALDRPQPAPKAKHFASEHPNQDFDYLDGLIEMLQKPDERESGSST
jgi:hypothetical protein